MSYQLSPVCAGAVVNGIVDVVVTGLASLVREERWLAAGAFAGV